MQKNFPSNRAHYATFAACQPTFLMLLATDPLLVIVLLHPGHEGDHAPGAELALARVQALAGRLRQLGRQLVVLQVQPSQRGELVEAQRQVRELPGHRHVSCCQLRS